MNRAALTHLAIAVLVLPAFAASQDLQSKNITAYPGWLHSGSLMVLTTPDGANLPASALVEQFPMLVRLHQDWFDFAQAKPHGEDVRFSTSTGEPMGFEMEEWDPPGGTATLWVRVPRISGNTSQQIRMHWGKSDAVSESNGKTVFNDSNGYLSVWHMNEPVKDEVGTLESKDVGTTVTVGIVGQARHFAGQQDIFGGDKITNYPLASAAHSTEAWFHAEKPNTTIIGWGNEGGGRGSKVRMQIRSPPHLRVDSDFSDIKADSRLALGEWIHVAHTYGDGPRRIYLNGKLDGEATTKLDIKNRARLWLGGWYNHYDFVGDLDEVRISKVVRPADWVRLEFENQKPLQTLVGSLMQAAETFAVSPAQATVPEGKSATFTAQAGGAQKVYWSLLRDGRETIVAVDRFAFQFDAGRVNRDTSATLRFKAIFTNEVKVRDIPITIHEEIPEPVFTLKAPHVWDGRQTIEVVPQISNLKAMQAQGAGKLKTEWSAGPFAVIKEIAPGKLLLKRAQKSGNLTVRATISNGGQPVTQTTTITVTEPTSDAWVDRTPAKDEKPEDGQFYARDDKNEGTLFYLGTLKDAADSVFLKLYADDQLSNTERAEPGQDQTYALTVKLKPGLIKYRVEFGTKVGGQETLRHTATNLVCGDAYIIDGQSNALATDTGEKSPPETNEWIRSYGWETYQPLFLEMSAGWKQDFPNVQHYYVFQIWPNSCGMGEREGSGDRLREKQRTLPQLYSHMSIMSTLGIRPPGGCHFPLAGWAEFARLIQPLIERDHYGKVPAVSITPPNLRQASYANGAKDTIALEFDQPVVWTDALAGQFYPDGEKDKVASGSVTGNVLTLKLKEPSTAQTITYLKEIAWSQDTLLIGANGLAALTFCEVPILPPRGFLKPIQAR